MSNETMPPCPECGSARTIPVVYGKPSDELVERWRKGEIQLGGCCRSEDGPTLHCPDCGYCWRP